jgi:protein phosphatase
MLSSICHGVSDLGKKRSSNQDHFLIAELNKSLKVAHTNISADKHARLRSDLNGRLLMVADGMGGHAGGEIASRLAIDSAMLYVLNTIPWFYSLGQDCDEDFQEELKRSLEHCQEKIAAATEAEPQNRGMGTTLTMAYFARRTLFVVHAGDSRCYLIREGEIHRLTRDHSMAQLLVDTGRLDAKSAEISPLSHCLYNSVGGDTNNPVTSDVSKTELEPGDTVLLCTDGLTRHVSNDELLNVVTGPGSLEEKNTKLVAIANREGGSDNITVVQALFTEDVTGDVPSEGSEMDTVVYP